jgi:small-conductance mechanosensitive channel
MLLQTAQPGEIFRYFTLGRFLSVVFVLLVTWVLIRYLSRLLAFLSIQGAKTRFLVKWIEPVLRIALWFVAIFVSFGVLAPTQETFLAAVGSLAIAIGLGAQDLVKNLIGGLVILADRPYQLGDRVRIGDAYGEIDHIGLRSTKLTTPDDTRVTIPNAEYSETPYLRLRVKAYVFDHRYENRMMNDITVRAKKEFSRLGLLAAWRATAEA